MKVYSANEITMMFAGVPIDSGRGDDEFCSITKVEDTYTYKAGVDGEGTRSENKNSLYRIIITLMRTSASNAVFSTIHNADKAIPGGSGIVPMMIRDRGGRSLFTTAEAWVVKDPDNTYAREANTIAWTIEAHGPINFIGGN